MAPVAVEKVNTSGTTSPSVFDDVKNLVEKVRQRAFELSQSRDAGAGSPNEDWFAAERDLFWAPPSDMVEKNGQFEVQFALPGFDPKDIQVSATPETLIIRANTSHKHENDEGDVHFCEFGQQEVFRQVAFPSPVNLDKVTANLEKGILRISAAKAEAKAVPAGKAAAA